MKKLKVLIIVFLFIILCLGIVYLVKEKNKACVNYTLDEAHLLVIRNTEPQVVGQSIKSPLDDSFLQEVPLRLPSEIKIKAYYSKKSNSFWILDVSQDYVQWFGPYDGHPCD